MKITFFGAVEEVTGSKYLIEHQNTKILVDCGLFQGTRDLTKHNWDKFPVDPKTLDALVLTHAHIDHTGYIPALVKKGFRGKIYCSNATFELCKILLVDSGNLQEEQAERVNNYKNHNKYNNVSQSVFPLYTKKDAENSFDYFQPTDYDAVVAIKSLQITLIRSGHILGSAFVVISDGTKKLTFSGDLGRPQQHQELLKAPPYLTETDYLVLESTYGNRIHENQDYIKQLGDVINSTIKKGGMIVIPAFTVMRTQTILYFLYQLKMKKDIPNIPIYLDSPEGIKVTNLFCQFKDELILSEEDCNSIMHVATYTSDVIDSQKLDKLQKPAVIIAGSGMADGGRVIYHLQRYVSDPKSTILFVGYQAVGTPGRLLVGGAKEINLYGKSYPVSAAIESLHGLSAHADSKEVLDWLSHFTKAPKKVFLTHGEIDGALALQKEIQDKFKWQVIVPKYKDSFDL